MLRTALQPRWLALLGVLLIVLYSFGRLGLWQMSLAQAAQIQTLTERADRDAAPLDDVITPQTAFPEGGVGRPVRASGVYIAEFQFTVPGRVLEGEDGWWVVTPLRTDQGALLPVLRGWVAQPSLAGNPDAAQRTVTGTLAPGETPAPGPDLPPGQLGAIDLAVLANVWPGDLYNGYVFASDQDPPVSAGEVTPVPTPSLAPDGIDWRNFGYAIQWWVFAAFALYMYARFLKQAAAPLPDEQSASL